MSGTFPETLRAYRTRAGLSQAALAALLGVYVSSVTRWEAGSHQPTRDNLARIASALGLSDTETDRLVDSTFGMTLRAYRRRAGLSQLALATRAGLDSTTVNRWESGARQPTREHVFAVALALGLTPRDTDRLLAAALYLPRDPASLLDDDLLVRAARLLAEGNPAQRACLRRGLVDLLGVVDGMLGFRMVGGGR